MIMTGKDDAMKLTADRIDRALTQMEARVIPESSPIGQELNTVFGEHTFFVSNEGLSTIEMVNSDQAESDQGRIVWLARWADEKRSRLVPHQPVSSSSIVVLGAAA